MKMQQYLAELHRILSFRYNRADMEDILAEYQSFFDAGIKDGKTDEELCRDFGLPREAVLRLREEYKPPLFPKTVIGRLALFGLLLALIAAVRYWLDKFIAAELAATGLSWLALWFLMGGSFRSLPPFAYPERKNNHAIILSNCLTLFFVIAAGIYHYITVQRIVAGVFPPTIQIKFILYGFIAIMLVSVVMNLYCFIRKSPEYYCSVCHAGGGLYSALYLYVLYSNMSEPAAFSNSFVYCGIPYIIGIAAALFFHHFINTLKRRRGEWTRK
jgi:hypothetical protein